MKLTLEQQKLLAAKVPGSNRMRGNSSQPWKWDARSLELFELVESLMADQQSALVLEVKRIQAECASADEYNESDDSYGDGYATGYEYAMHAVADELAGLLDKIGS